MADTTNAAAPFLAGPEHTVPAGWVRSGEIGARTGRFVVFDPARHDVSIVIGRDRATDDVYDRLGYQLLHADDGLQVRVRDRDTIDTAGPAVRRSGLERLAGLRPAAGCGCVGWGR